MKKIQIADMQASQIILGCMRIIEPGKNPVKVIETAYENGINFFDHADIYGAGQCETFFAEALAQTSIRREDIYLQSKCAIRPGVAFDFSKEHIIKSVEGSLQRLQTDYLDTMLLAPPRYANGARRGRRGLLRAREIWKGSLFWSFQSKSNASGVT